MTEFTRRSLLAAVGVAATAGCLSDGPAEGSTTIHPGETTGETPRTESPERETTEESPETSGDWVTHASNRPDPDHAVTLANRSDATETVRVRVVRKATDETVFEATETVDPGVELDLYNVKQADPEGIEAFEICGEVVESEKPTDDPVTTEDSDDPVTTAETTTAQTTTTARSDRRDCATIRTSECYANAHVTVDESGALQVIYAVC